MQGREKRIGRILDSTDKHSRAELTDDAMEGMLVSVNRQGYTFLGRIEKIESQKFGGLIGYIYWLDYLGRPFSSMTEIFMAEEETETGHIYIGEDQRNIKVKLPVNPLFGHVLVAGMTTVGKTHLLIVIAEELGQLGVPCLIIDPQGEFINLPVIDRERYVVVEELRIENLINHMQQKRIVVYNLLGYSKITKISRVAELLQELMNAKEKDYQQAAADPRLLQMPPILIIIDEADIFAPNLIKGQGEGARESVGPVVDLLERGAKFGLGTIVATQRITRLDIDVRSQCNSAMIFRMIDAGSVQAAHNIDYIPEQEIHRIRALEKGAAIIAGNLVKRVRRVQIRDIKTPRAKHRDFEKMLGIQPPEEVEFETRLEETAEGDIVDLITKEVIRDAADKLADADKAAFEKAEDDGVVIRSHITPEEQKVLNRLRKPDKNGDRLIG